LLTNLVDYTELQSGWENGFMFAVMDIYRQ